MKAIVLVCVLMALAACAVIDSSVSQLRPATPDVVQGPSPPPPCAVQTSVWTMPNYPIPGNTVTFTFEIRDDCIHYFKISSPCTRYEVTYTTTHSTTASPGYTVNSISQNWINLINCPSIMAAALEGNVVYAFYPVPKSGWYRIFLTPFTKLHWGGYVANWVSGPKKVWFS